MTEFKGTPGPWQQQADEESMATAVVMSEFGDILCVVGTYMTSAEEDFDNASLIAAAPELLEALQKLHDYAEDVCGVCPDDCHEEHPLMLASSAISKALGKE